MFTPPPQFSVTNGRILLNFGAIDWQSTVWVNTKCISHNWELQFSLIYKVIGNHTGGYDHFSYDITEEVTLNSGNELLIYVYDPSGILQLVVHTIR